VRINRTQGLVLAFGVVAWVSVVIIVAVAPEILVGTLRLPPSEQRGVSAAFLLALSAFLVLPGVGVVRAWRWTFWLILVAFLAGLLRVPASALELIGMLPVNGPTWYVLLQAGIGLVQFVIGLAMISGLRRAGVWGAFGWR
jgi:hypothetical protein